MGEGPILTEAAGSVLVRLALALGEGAELGGQMALVVDQRVLREAFNQLGETVLIYRYVSGVLLHFVGRGTVTGTSLSADGTWLVTLDPYIAFPAPVLGEAELGVPGARRMLRLSADRWREIERLAEVGDFTGAEEASLPFAIDDAPPLQTFLKLHDQVLGAWGYRCAVTGQVFASRERPHPMLRLVPIRPRELGGPMHVSNYLPMIEMAERAWLSGAIGVTEDLDFVAVLNRLDPSLLEAMPRSGKLIVPDDPDQQPDQALLAWHFASMYGA
jgi:hypothetical protein